MDVSQIYILISIVVLLIIAILVFFVKKNKKQQKPLTPLAGVAFAFIVAGILFGDNRIIGYSLMGVGVIFAIIDIIKNRKK
jgi:RsiW-degrading membrane proteinase PrsW (M82 family)